MKELLFDIEKIVNKKAIANELEYERALAADKRLRLLSKESVHHKTLRAKLRNILEEYENKIWSDIDEIDDAKLEESNEAEELVRKEQDFINKRKNIIKSKLKELNITQQELAHILGHKSKTHMSELMNGLTPFKLRDLIIINTLLDIDFASLIPTFLSQKDMKNVKKAIADLNRPQLKFPKKDSISY